MYMETANSPQFDDLSLRVGDRRPHFNKRTVIVLLIVGLIIIGFYLTYFIYKDRAFNTDTPQNFYYIIVPCAYEAKGIKY
jgi:hypothetical protein